MHLTVDPEWDLIEVLAYGSVTDLIGSDRYVVLVEDHLALVLGPALDEVTGFVVRGAAKFDVLAHEDVEDIWNGPRFRVPVLGLTDASVGEILLAIGGRFAADEPTADAMHFHAAIQETEPARAVVQWHLALEAGDMKAHYALGYTLCENGAFREAYDHLRHYTEIAQNNAWAWCWYGKASAGCDLLGEARDAYERAIAIDEHETDAPELLAALDEPGGSVSSDA
jgi:tetratricopeptide (TPR) repeat protein